MSRPRNADTVLAIVVPVWNTELHYVERCLSSLSQACRDEYDVLVVDDGSTAEMSAAYQGIIAKLPDNFSYLHQQNSGQNAARNRGVRACNSSYVTFVDSDDYLIDGSVQRIVDLLKKNSPDILMFGSSAEGDSPDGDVNCTEAEHLSEQAKRDLIASQCSLWGLAYSRSLLLENPLVEGIHIAEDFASVLPLIVASREICFTRVKLYRHCMRPTSVTQSAAYRYPLEILKAFDSIRGSGLDRVYPEEIEWQGVKHLLYWEPLRLYNASMLNRGNRDKLFSYMNGAFPGWRLNRYLLSEKTKLGHSFGLLVSGRWGMYRFLRRMKDAIKSFGCSSRQELRQSVERR